RKCRRSGSNIRVRLMSVSPLAGLAWNAQLAQELSYRLAHTLRSARVGVAAYEVAGDRIDPHRARIRNRLQVSFDVVGRIELILRAHDVQRRRLDRAQRRVHIAIETRGIADPATAE